MPQFGYVAVQRRARLCHRLIYTCPWLLSPYSLVLMDKGGAVTVLVTTSTVAVELAAECGAEESLTAAEDLTAVLESLGMPMKPDFGAAGTARSPVASLAWLSEESLGTPIKPETSPEATDLVDDALGARLGGEAIGTPTNPDICER